MNNLRFVSLAHIIIAAINLRNSYSPHLLRYLFAKLLIATKRKNEYIAITMDQDPDGVNKILPRLNRDGSEFLLLVWQRILEAFKMKEGSSLPAFEHAMQIGCISLQDDGDTVREGREDLTPEKWEIIRSFFRSKAEGNLVNDES